MSHRVRPRLVWIKLSALLIGIALTACQSNHRRFNELDRPGHPSAADPAFLEQYAATNRFRLGKPGAIRVTPDGDAVLFLRSGARSFAGDLWVYDVSRGTERILLTSDQLLGGTSESLTAEELARRERTRSAARGIASFDLSKDGMRVLVSLSGQLFVFDRGSEKIRSYSSDHGFPIDARFSPDGTKIACVRDGDLYVIDVESGAESRLTERPNALIEHGLAEFVAQEEMKRMSGYWWSPDSQWIAYQRTDVAGVETMHIADPVSPTTPPQTWPYPRPGKANAAVELGVIPATGGQTVWIDWDAEAHPYLASVVWTEHAPLTIVTQNRRQTVSSVWSVETTSGSVTHLFDETDEAWINIDQDVPRWLPDGSAFLWTTERNGAWQIELRRRDGILIRAVTPPTPAYRGIEFVDADGEVVFYRASEDPTESHLYATSIRDGSIVPRLLTRAQPGFHTLTSASRSGVAVHHFAPKHGRESWMIRELHTDSLGDMLGALRSDVERPSFDPNLELTTIGEDPVLHAAIIRPRNFDPGAMYPVIVHVYGGPGVQTVTAQPERYLLDQWIADHGYIVVWIDGRGTPARGRDWERAIKGNFIDVPLADQVSGLRLVADHVPQMDTSRVGVFGWSFGGYFSAMATMRAGEVFHCGFAGAPVCDWLDYDTHYTERFLGIPQKSSDAYRVSNVLTYADRLERPLLIYHGTADDNVFLVHSLKMSDALFRSGREHEFVPLAGLTHMVVEPVAVQRMYSHLMRFFAHHLQR